MKISGLSNEQVLESRKLNGNNQISQLKKHTFFQLLLESLGDPIIKILLIALMIKVVFLFKDFDWFETIGILIAVFLATFISTISEYGSEAAFRKLQQESDDVKVKVSSTPFFGGVEVKRGKQSSKKEITIYLNSVCIFGGVDVK